jgi:hypothetical protein
MWNWRETVSARTAFGLVISALVLLAWATGLIRL